VPVGKVDEVVPQGKTVKVTLSVDRDTKVPADAGAVLVSPTVVSDRYVQLAPVYRGGPTMRDGAVIPQDRTATPVELDQIYKSLNSLTTALGPQGANKNGALTDVLNTGAANLQGNGQAMAESLSHLGEAGKTLSGNSKQLFGTIDNLQKFTTMVASNDQQVRQFNTQMQQVSGFLAGERQDFAKSLQQLSVALAKVDTFVKDNRQHLKTNVDQLNSVAQVLVKERAALDESLNNAPLALDGVYNAYNAASGTLDTRANINELNQPPAVAACKLLQQSAPGQAPPQVADACRSLQPVLSGQQKLPTPAQTLQAVQQGKLPPLPLPLLTADGAQVPTPGGGR
jgi:virulence factor Mce-like protein